MKNVGIVDSEYIVHLGLPTLGGNKAGHLPNFYMALFWDLVV